MSWKAFFVNLIQSFVGSVADAGAGRVTEKIAPKGPSGAGKKRTPRT